MPIRFVSLVGGGSLCFSLLLSGCSALQLVGLAPSEPPPKKPLPYTVAIAAPAPASPDAGGGERVHPMPVDLAALQTELAAALDGKVFSKVVSPEEADIIIKPQLLSARVRYAGPPVNRFLWVLWNLSITSSFVRDDTFRADVGWRLELESRHNGRRLYFKDLDVGDEVSLNDWQRGFIFFSSLRLPGALDDVHWRRITKPLEPALRRGLVSRSQDDLVTSFAALTRKDDFEQLLRDPIDDGPARLAPDITLETRGPEVRVRQNEYTLTFEVSAPENTKVQVLLNGKPLVEGSKDIGGLSSSMVVGTVGNRVKRRHQVALPLAEGQNQVQVVAESPDAVKSTADVVVHYDRVEGRTYVLAVGVGDYQDPAIPDLKWTENDATAFASFFSADPKSPAPKENVRLITGGEATKRNILKALSGHLEKQAVNEEDTVVFYFSGHGGVNRSATSGTEYFLYPYDAEESDLSVTGLEVSELQRRWGAIRAKTKIFISDACHGGGITVKGEQEGAERVGQGSVTFSAAKASERSMELADLGHGLFTHFLLEGLKGAADDRQYQGNADGRISVTELKGYLDRAVTAEAAKRGGRQTPMARIESSGEIFLTK